MSRSSSKRVAVAEPLAERVAEPVPLERVAVASSSRTSSSSSSRAGSKLVRLHLTSTRGGIATGTIGRATGTIGIATSTRAPD